MMEKVHLIKFDLVSWRNRKSKRGQRIRLSCELWNKDRLLDFLKEGNCYNIIGELKEFEYQGKDGKMKRKYSVEVNEIFELNMFEKERNEQQISGNNE